MRIAVIALALSVALAAGSDAQGAPKAKAPAKPAAKAAAAPVANVTLGQVRDRRSDGQYFNKLEIAVALPDYQAAEVAAARTVVTAAVDDTGRDLVPEDAAQSALQSTGGAPEPGKPAPAEVALELKNPARKAATVRSIAGEIELYLPGRDPAAVATVPKVLAQTGKTIADAALKANGVTITVVGKEQLEAEKKRFADAARAQAKKDGYTGNELKERIDELVAGFYTPEPGALVLLVKAPADRIHEFAFVDGAGEEKRCSAAAESGLTVLSTWGETPAPDWGLRVRMKTAKTLVRLSFALKDVPLP